MTIGSCLVLELVVLSCGLDGSRARVIEESLEFFAFGVKDPDPVFQSCAAFRDTGDGAVPVDMVYESSRSGIVSGWGHSAVRWTMMVQYLIRA